MDNESFYGHNGEVLGIVLLGFRDYEIVHYDFYEQIGRSFRDRLSGMCHESFYG